MKWSWSSVAMMLVLCGPLGAWGRTLSWDEAVNMAVSNNPELQSSIENLKSVKEQEGVVRAAYFPQLSAQLGGVRNGPLPTNDPGRDVYTAQLNLTENLFAGFVDQSKITQAEANTRSAEADVKIKKAKISADLKNAFENILFAQDYLTLARSILERRKENLRMLELRFEGGRENKGSLYLFRAYVVESQSDERYGRRLVQAAQAEFAHVLGLDDDGDLFVSGKIPRKEPGENEPAFHDIARQNPEVLKAVSDEQSAQSGIDIAHAAFLPSLDAAGAYGHIDNRYFPEAEKWNFGLTLTLPLFNGGKDLSQTRSATAKWRSQTLARSAKEKEIFAKLRTAWNDWLTAFDHEKVADGFVRAAQVRADIARNSYNNGLWSFNDWDWVENDLIDRRHKDLDAQKDRIAKEAAWEQAAGTGVIP